MRILIVSQYFWPENFRINEIAVDLVSRGHQVYVLTGKPNYPGGNFYNGYSLFSNSFENWKGIIIYRSAVFPRGKGSGFRLFLNYFSFSFFASIKALFIEKQIDKIFVFEPSPISVGIPAIVAKMRSGAPIFFWVQDLWPASIMAAGEVRNRFVLAIASSITKYVYKHSFKILVQSKGFIDYILNQGVDDEKLIYFPNTSENFYRMVVPKVEYLSKLPVGFKIMFAGNIGNGQSFSTLLDAAITLKKEGVDVNWIIIGDGRMKQWVAKKIIELGLEDCFFLLGSYPPEEMPYFFSCADALLVSLKRDPVFELTIPSKIQSYLACGKPLLGSIDGEGARIIDEANAGLTAPSEDSVGLALIVKELLRMDKGDRQMMGANGRRYYELEFERELLLDKLEIILNN